MDYTLLVLCLFAVLFRDVIRLNQSEENEQADSGNRTTEQKQRRAAHAIKQSLLRGAPFVERLFQIGFSKMDTHVEHDEAQRHNDAMEIQRRQLTTNRWLAFAAIGSLLGVIWQGCQMVRQIETDNRAWLAIVEPRVDVPPTGKYAMQTTFKTRNLGKTPAHVTGYFVRSVPLLRQKGFPATFERPISVPPFRTIVAPGDESELIAYDTELELTDAEKAALADTPTALMVQWVITYDDSFGKHRVTARCYFYSPHLGKLTEFIDGHEMN